MTKANNSKRALVTSVLAIIMCVAMLVGTTFAWFTDTASTAVNKIQAGNLDVDIVDDAGNSLNGKTLSFKNKENKTDILWEPGATFNLDSFRIVNKGSLAFKYKVIISGVDGNAKLLKAIDFTVKTVTEEKPLANWSGILLPNGSTVKADGEVVGTTESLTIYGKMREDAGNEYQGLSIDGLGITVVATQYTYEDDSFDNTYDEKAAYPVVAPILNETTDAKTSENGDIIITTDKAVSTVPAAAAIKTDEGEQDIADNGKLTRNLKTTELTTDSVTYDISYSYTENGATTAVSEFTDVVTNVISLTPGLKNVKVTHSHGGAAVAMTEAASENAKADGYFFYNASTGKLTIWSSAYSQFKVTYSGAEYTEIADETGFNDKKLFINGYLQRDAHVVLTDDVVSSKSITLQLSGLQLILDLNGHKLTIPQIILNNDATVMITDSVGTGEIDFTSQNGIQANYDGANIVLNGGTLKASSTYKIYSFTVEKFGTVVMLSGKGSSFVMNGGKIVADNDRSDVPDGSIAVRMYRSNTSFIMNGGEIVKNVGTLAAIQASGDGTTENTKIEINDGSIKSNTVAIYHPQKGNMTVNGGYIEGETAIYAKSGTLVFGGGTMHATADTATDYKYNSNGLVATGDAVVIDACGYPGGNPDVTVTGGTYTVTADGAHGFAYYKYNGNTATINNTSGIEIFEQ